MPKTMLELVEEFKALPEDEQQALLAELSPEARAGFEAILMTNSVMGTFSELGISGISFVDGDGNEEFAVDEHGMPVGIDEQ